MRASVTSVLGLFGLLLCACGGGAASIDVGAMPQGGSYTGVWHSPQYGEMHLVQAGNSVTGEFTKDERQGSIQGTMQGDVLRFQWSQRLELIAGRPTTTTGRGYFRYVVGDDGDHYLRGEWGHDEEIRGGGPWNAVRDRRRQPNVSEQTSGSEADDNVEAFDSADDSSTDSSGGGSSDLDGL